MHSLDDTATEVYKLKQCFAVNLVDAGRRNLLKTLRPCMIRPNAKQLQLPLEDSWDAWDIFNAYAENREDMTSVRAGAAVWTEPY